MDVLGPPLQRRVRLLQLGVLLSPSLGVHKGGFSKGGFSD